MFPGGKSVFRAGFRPDSNRESLRIGPPAHLRPAEGPILRLSRLKSGPEVRCSEELKRLLKTSEVFDNSAEVLDQAKDASLKHTERYQNTEI